MALSPPPMPDTSDDVTLNDAAQNEASNLPHPPTEIITIPGPISRPNDMQMNYNAFRLPPNFHYRVQGMFSVHLRLNVSKIAQQAWDNANDHAVIIVPLYMTFSLSRMQKAKVDTLIFLKRAFPESAATLNVVLPAKAANQNPKLDEPLPWGIMVAGLQYQDAATLLHHHFWLSYKFSFVAYPATPFTSDWIGNWAFAADESDEAIVLECLRQNLATPQTTIGKYLMKAIPDEQARQDIINSARVRPIRPIPNDNDTIHWAFLVDSPHPEDVDEHRLWVNAAYATEWFHPAISAGELRIPRTACRCCKGRDHFTVQCPLTKIPYWRSPFPSKVLDETDFSLTNANSIAEYERRAMSAIMAPTPACKTRRRETNSANCGGASAPAPEGETPEPPNEAEVTEEQSSPEAIVTCKMLRIDAQ
ncbi:uncharacterized protein EI90DRAFT_833280 [Cantharellus anzutake]|uniref:uncharacterized protein n=1 Tax=Cantharellus anzutake TaxID=1750568 RepID=UPI0019037C74|nr:uncharacterized protein EI90DRAFT_833280 [Cantharellus anzutake]KAF8343142.1 hypothetical protein EI90DRAFT_833280 [Cantharellus anzutake]